MKLTLDNIEPLADSIIFQFLQPLKDGHFGYGATDTGIVLAGTDNDPRNTRWIKVLKTGPLVDTVKSGDYAVVENAKWTYHVNLSDDEKYFRTLEEYLMFTSDTPPKYFISEFSLN